MISENAFASERLLSIAVIGLMLMACTSLRVGSDFDRTSSFAGYHTFSWMPREHYGTATRSWSNARAMQFKES